MSGGYYNEEIGGHTDVVGTEEYKIVLSGRRAMAIKNYLVERGVKQDKVEIKKYGESAPIASNNSNSTRKYNRRIEFKVLEQGSEKYLKVACLQSLQKHFFQPKRSCNQKG